VCYSYPVELQGAAHNWEGQAMPNLFENVINENAVKQLVESDSEQAAELLAILDKIKY
jgi:hypothetical protein